MTSYPVPENTYYLGHVASDPSSTVAVSNYGGLVRFSFYFAISGFDWKAKTRNNQSNDDAKTNEKSTELKKECQNYANLLICAIGKNNCRQKLNGGWTKKNTSLDSVKSVK